MVWLIVLGIIVGIIVLIMLIPVGADVGYVEGQLSVSAKVCGVLIKLLPKKPVDETKPQKQKKPKKEKKPKEPKADKPKKPRKKLELNMDEKFALVRAALKGFGKFGKLTVDRFMLHYVAGGEDPYNTAMTYNYVNAALSTLAPVCASRFIVKDSDVRTDVDFTLDKPKIDVGVCVVIRIGQVFRMGFAIAFGVLGILLKNKLRLLREKRLRKRNGEDLPTENPDNVVNTEQNIQQEERMDSNG